MESNQVPLVIYTNGTRTVVGMARVEADGAVHAIVSKDRWPEIKHLFFDPGHGEFSVQLGPIPARVHPIQPPLRPAERSYLDRLVEGKMQGINNIQEK